LSILPHLHTEGTGGILSVTLKHIYLGFGVDNSETGSVQVHFEESLFAMYDFRLYGVDNFKRRDFCLKKALLKFCHEMVQFSRII